MLCQILMELVKQWIELSVCAARGMLRLGGVVMRLACGGNVIALRWQCNWNVNYCDFMK